MKNDLNNSNENLTVEEIAEKLRYENVQSLLQKVCNKIPLNEVEVLELSSSVKLSDFTERNFIVKKKVEKKVNILKVTYSDNSFNFVSLNNEISAKRIPIQILACKYGSPLNWLIANKFEIDNFTKNSQFSDSFRKLVLETSKNTTIDKLNLAKQSSKFETRKFAGAIKLLDIKKGLATNVSYGTCTNSVLAKFAEAKAKAEKIESEAKAKKKAELEAKKQAKKELQAKTKKATNLVAEKSAKLAELKKVAEDRKIMLEKEKAYQVKIELEKLAKKA